MRLDLTEARVQVSRSPEWEEVGEADCGRGSGEELG